jgi:hypothetical protein
LVDRVDGEPRNLCFADIRWVAVEDLPQYDLLTADLEFAQRLARRAFF